MLRIRPDFRLQLARSRLSMKEVAARAGVSYSTLRFIERPLFATAWKIAHVLAENTDLTPDQAFDLLFATDTEMEENYSPLPAAA